MNKQVVAIVAGIILVVVGGMAYLLAASPEEQTAGVRPGPAESTQLSPPARPPQPVQDTQDAGKGTYVNYSEQALATTEGTRLLFFHASWCPQCRKLEADITAKGVPEGVTILKVDYDSSQALRQKYGVTLQTTMVRIDESGNLVKKFVAYDDPSLDAVKANLLQQ